VEEFPGSGKTTTRGEDAGLPPGSALANTSVELRE